MREILFKGKRTDNGEWIFGDLRHWPSGSIGIRDDTIGHTFKVVPETVGQFTGKDDRNGKKVFEHDILQILIFDGVSRGVVQWCENDQCYVLTTKEGWHIDDFGNYGRPEYYEVIGNIHDNQNLLGGAE